MWLWRNELFSLRNARADDFPAHELYHGWKERGFPIDKCQGELTALFTEQR
jgi:hypothetical protein